jgi:hypothetical protein
MALTSSTDEGSSSKKPEYKFYWQNKYQIVLVQIHGIVLAIKDKEKLKSITGI